VRLDAPGRQRPDERVADVVENGARDRPGVEVDFQRRLRSGVCIDVSGDDLICKRKESEQTSDHDEPAAGEEQSARVIDGSDPVEAVLAGLRDQHLNAARCHQNDADDEHERRQDGGGRANCGEVRVLRAGIIRGSRRE
jgi:hypothetical protein